MFQSVAILQAMQKPMFPMYLGIARQLVVPASINYVLIVVWGYPMVSMFYTIVTVVILSAIIAFFYTRREIYRVKLWIGLYSILQIYLTDVLWEQVAKINQRFDTSYKCLHF